MRIVQSVFGTFHHFELARELARRGHLERIFSTFPWRRLEREGLSRDKVTTFPWVHMTQFALARTGLLPAAGYRALSHWNGITFDHWLASHVPACDAFIALSGAGLVAGRRVQERGGIYVCDRGSTHRRTQETILVEEYRRWGREFRREGEREMRREEAMYALADAISVPSSVVKQSFIDQGVPAEKVHVLPYGVRLEAFGKRGDPPAGPDAPFQVLFVGSVSLRKGIPYLLQAFSRLRHPKKELTIIGSVDAELKPVLEQLPQTSVSFLGSRPQATLPEFMSTHHAMVLPSVEEGLALVQAQALSTGCPVIATVATGAQDLFTDGIEGFIVPDRDVDAIADRLQRLADEPELRERMSAAAQLRVAHLGGWNRYGDQWEALLHRLTGKA